MNMQPAYRRTVGKLQRMTYTRPDISYATKELATALQAPTTADQQKLKHLLRYLKGTQHYKQVIRPTAKRYLQHRSQTSTCILCEQRLGRLSRNKKVNNNRLCHHTTWINNQLWQPNTGNKCTQVQKQSFTQSTQEQQKHYIYATFSWSSSTSRKSTSRFKIHTDSSSGKSMATRIGSSRKAKRPVTPFHTTTDLT